MIQYVVWGQRSSMYKETERVKLEKRWRRCAFLSCNPEAQSALKNTLFVFAPGVALRLLQIYAGLLLRHFN